MRPILTALLRRLLHRWSEGLRAWWAELNPVVMLRVPLTFPPRPVHLDPDELPVPASRTPPHPPAAPPATGSGPGREPTPARSGRAA
ncbi:hypothetical protein [Streptacidiphilus rugosus]|uniref:hypothetical protein n=1 Tax=Streptacidiphilus rugosus TaxID=405783 RepID=UPI00055B405C|nr:hypothetical protein [Streptacidiphilus rugosus]